MAYDAAARRIRGDAAITNFRPGETLPAAAAHDGLHGESTLTLAPAQFRLGSIKCCLGSDYPPSMYLGVLMRENLAAHVGSSSVTVLVVIAGLGLPRCVC